MEEDTKFAPPQKKPAKKHDISEPAKKPEEVTDRAATENTQAVSTLAATTTANTQTAPTQQATTTKKKNSAIWIFVAIIALYFLCILCLCGTIFFFILITPADKRTSTTSTSSNLKITSTPAISPSPKTKASAGFDWIYCSNMSSWFSRPFGWVKRESNGNSKTPTPTCIIIRPVANNSTESETSFTVVYYKDVSLTSGYKASEYAQKLLTKLLEGKINPSKIGTGEDGSYEALTASYDYTSNGKTHYVNVLAMADDQTDVVYIMTFDAVSTQWNNDWGTYGKHMMQEFQLGN